MFTRDWQRERDFDYLKPPAFLFYADDFLAGTMGMTPSEVGCYIRLLCVQWNSGQIPDDMDILKRLSGDMPTPYVISKFKKSGTGLKNARMEFERKKQKEYRVNRSESGKKGANSRWHSHSTAMAQPMAKDGIPLPLPFSIPKEEETPEAFSEKETARMKSGKGSLSKNPSLEEVKLSCQNQAISESDAVWFWNKCEGNGWTNGGKAIKSWPHVLSSWKAAGYLPSQKNAVAASRPPGGNF